MAPRRSLPVLFTRRRVLEVACSRRNEQRSLSVSFTVSFPDIGFYSILFLFHLSYPSIISNAARQQETYRGYHV